MMIVARKLFVFVMVATALAACSPKSNPDRKVEDMIGPSQKTNGVVGQDIALQKSALGEKFLLQTSVIEQDKIPMFNGGRSRVVTFRVRDNQVVMNESSEGNVATKDLEQNLILATFPIVSQTSDVVVFDFNAGMSRIFTASDWTTSDYDGREFKPGNEVAKVRTSYIEDLKYISNHFVIRQIAQVEVTNMLGATKLTTTEAKYYLTPYSQDPTFEPQTSKDLKTFGFFEVSPKLGYDGNTTVYASKFNNKQNITFALSADIPAEYREATREAVLYWNKAFGYEAIKVIDAPVGVKAPDLDYNVIQWVTWDQAGFAYADAQMDPNNGQILHAQVYFTSVFALGGKARARRILDRLKASGKTSFSRIGLAGLTDSGLCNLDHTQRLVGMIESLLSSNASDATILRASQDYIREVVAHEVGHTLGLRHNFGGSLAQSYSMSERPALVKNYLESATLDENVTPSSSVMDYQNFEESIFSGHIISKNAKAMEYDQKAIERLYLNKSFKRSEVPVFCTDSAVGPYADCQRFDAGRTAVEWTAWRGQDILSNLKYSLMETFVRAKSPAPGEEQIPVEETKFDIDTVAKALTDSRDPLAMALVGKAKIWSVYRQFNVIDVLNEEIVKAAQQEHLKTEIANNGGLGAVFAKVPTDFTAKQVEALNALVDSGVYTTGMGAYGVPYTLSQEELNAIKVRGAAYIAKLNDKLVDGDVAMLAGLTDIPEGVNQADILALLNDRLNHYVFSTKEAVAPVEYVVKDKESNDVTLKLPVFAFTGKVREKAAAFVAGSKFVGFAIGEDERKANKDKYKAMMTEAVGDLDKLDEETLPKDVRKWLKEAKAVQNSL